MGRTAQRDVVVLMLVDMPVAEGSRIMEGVAEREPGFGASVIEAIDRSKIAGTAHEEALLSTLFTASVAQAGSEVPAQALVAELAPRLNFLEDSFLRRSVLVGMARYPKPEYHSVLAERGRHLVETLDSARHPEPAPVRGETQAYLRAVAAHGDEGLAYFAARIGEASRVRETISLASEVARGLLE